MVIVQVPTSISLPEGIPLPCVGIVRFILITAARLIVSDLYIYIYIIGTANIMGISTALQMGRDHPTFAFFCKVNSTFDNNFKVPYLQKISNGLSPLSLNSGGLNPSKSRSVHCLPLNTRNPHDS